jgi:hypothetical protein
MRVREPEGNAALRGVPGAPPVGPGPLAGNFRRPALAPVIEQTGKQHRPVLDAHAGAEALQLVQTEIRIRRNEVEVPDYLTHEVLPIAAAERAGNIRGPEMI